MTKTLLVFVSATLIATSFVSAQVGYPAGYTGNLGDFDPENPVSACVVLTSTNLRYRSRDINTNGEVSLLQDFLNANGYLQSEPTGFFGAATLQAVRAFQQNSGLSSTGYVGTLTKAKIKEISCGTSTPPICTADPTLNAPQMLCNGLVVHGVWSPEQCKYICPNINNQSTLSIEKNVGGNPLKVQAKFYLGSYCSDYILTWGDGTNSNFTNPPNLSCIQSVPTDPFSATHVYQQAGTYTVTFQTGNTKVAQTITVGSSNTGLNVASMDLIGTQTTYTAGQSITFSAKLIADDGTPANTERGFNVQSSITDGYNAVYVNGVAQSVNANYDAASKLWKINMVAPSDTSKTYIVDTAGYCSNSSLGCRSTSVASGNSSGQINKTFNFRVSGTSSTRPELQSISQKGDYTSGGVADVYGSGFTDSISVKISDASGQQFTVPLTILSSTNGTFVVPATLTSGYANVRLVKNAGTGNEMSSLNLYTYLVRTTTGTLTRLTIVSVFADTAVGIASNTASPAGLLSGEPSAISGYGLVSGLVLEVTDINGQKYYPSLNVKSETIATFTMPQIPEGTTQFVLIKDRYTGNEMRSNTYSSIVYRRTVVSGPTITGVRGEYSPGVASDSLYVGQKGYVDWTGSSASKINIGNVSANITTTAIMMPSCAPGYTSCGTAAYSGEFIVPTMTGGIYTASLVSSAGTVGIGYPVTVKAPASMCVPDGVYSTYACEGGGAAIWDSVTCNYVCPAPIYLYPTTVSFNGNESVKPQVASAYTTFIENLFANTSAKFVSHLSYGMRNNPEVKALQILLSKEGLLTLDDVSGNFLDRTLNAVKQFQDRNGLESVGSVGPLTRDILNRALAKVSQ